MNAGRADFALVDRPAAQPAQVARVLSVQRWLVLVGTADSVCAAAAMAGALVLRFGLHPGAIAGVPYFALVPVLPPIWLGVLWLTGAYRKDALAYGVDEYQRVLFAGLALVVTYALLALAFQANLSRSVVASSVALVTALTLLERYVARQRLHRIFATRWALHRVVILGTPQHAKKLAEHIGRAPHLGYKIAAVWPIDTEVRIGNGSDSAALSLIAQEVRAAGADTLMVANPDAMPQESLRRLGWTLEGTGIQLVVAPSVVDFAGPRIVVRPVAGLPLLHIEEPDFTGPRRLAKATLDRVVAALLMLLLSPMLAVVALAVWLEDRRSPFFKQARVGLGGDIFWMWKFRSMRASAESERGDLEAMNEQDGLTFKIRHDPRVTTAGRWLRRYSVDELPQLWNVLRGQMSLVGPRPATPDEVARYSDDISRRLRVKPGMTGLWQINGRSDLRWDESIRLDLYYVENWSPMLDLMVIWKTARAVVQGRGAY